MKNTHKSVQSASANEAKRTDNSASHVEPGKNDWRKDIGKISNAIGFIYGREKDDVDRLVEAIKEIDSNR
jgi:hypothetical protein